MIEDAPLTEVQQQMMAYVDDELAPEERKRFEVELASNADLAAEVAGYMNLMQLSHATHHLEPADHEMRHFWQAFYNRSEWKAGWVFFVGGACCLLGIGLYEVYDSEWIHWPAKIAIFSTVLGGGILLWNTIRLKMHTSRFDRYKGVMR